MSYILLVAGALGCAGGERTTPPPTGPGPGPDTTGTVQRGTLTGTVTIDSADRAIAAALAIDPQSPAGFTVTLTQLSSSTSPPRTTTTDALGRFQFGALLEGSYLVSIERAIGDSERARLAPDDADVTAFAAGGTVVLRPGTNAQSFAAVAGRRGSLVISELWPHGPALASRGGWGYPDGRYLEVYNNADTTVYLDGVYLGAIPPVTLQYGTAPPDFDFCGTYGESIRLNANALGAGRLLRFPGSGREYPLAPGEAAVVAKDAIDHTEFAEGTVNLSGARFESIGDSRDVDNPSSANLERIIGGIGALGRGWDFGIDQFPGLYFLASADARVDRQNLGAGWASDVAFVESSKILDAVGLTTGAETRNIFFQTTGARITDCVPFMHPRYERAAPPLLLPDTRTRGGYARRALRTLPDGRVILQRTRTSARDWVLAAEPTPGRP